MTYLYKCPHCKIGIEITKPMEEVDRIEYCHICESELKRVWESPSTKTGDGFKK